MLEFIKIAYFCTMPLLVCLIIAGSPAWKKTGVNLLAVTNLLSIGNSVFVCQQMVGLYQFARSFKTGYSPITGQSNWIILQFVCMVVLPLFSLHGYVRKNVGYSVVVFLLLYQFYPPPTWNGYGLTYKIVTYGCLLCAAYALLWLLKKLPYQSPVN